MLGPHLYGIEKPVNDAHCNNDELNRGGLLERWDCDSNARDYKSSCSGGNLIMKSSTPINTLIIICMTS